MPKRFDVIRKKLGQNKAWGIAYHNDSRIYIDERLKGKKELEIIIHESMHILFPEMEETDIVKNSVILTNTLWHQQYRKIDNFSGDPLQDGTK